MTFNPNVPNAGETPGVFPIQNNTNFGVLQNIIGRDHIFNLTPSPGDNSGTHLQVTLTARADPVSLPTGTNAVLYAWVDGLSQTQLKYYNGTSYFQITPTFTVISGTVTVPAFQAFANITAVPANVFGEIYLWKNRFIQQGTFVSDASIVNGYSFAEKFTGGSGASQILNLGFDGSGASGLNLTVANTGSSSFNGVWNYKIFYRSTT
jgi:hypothetical protein